MYKICFADGRELGVVLRLEDNAYIPKSKGNTDYQEYLVWLAEGNTPEPADEPAAE